MTKGYRQGRIGEEIRRIISEMLLSDLKDPRLDSMISITDVEVTKDNSYATVYFSPLGVKGSEEDQIMVESILNLAGANDYSAVNLGDEIQISNPL